MKPIDPKSRGWLMTLGATSGLAAYVICLFMPGYKSIRSMRRELEEKRRFVTAANLQVSSLAQLDSQLMRTNQHVDKWRKSCPKDPNLVELLGKLAVLANQTAIRVHRLSPQETVNMAVLRQHPLVLEVEGTFSQVVDFLGRVEELPETVWVRQLKMKPSDQNGGTVQCELMLTVFADNREISG